MDTSSQRQNPYLKAGWLSKITFWWVSGLFYTAYRRPLQQEDMYPVLPWLRAQDNGARFEKRWEDLSQKEKDKSGSLLKHLLLHFKRRIAFTILIELLAELTRFAIPLLIARLINYLDGSGRTSHTAAYVYLVLVVVSTFTLIPLHAHCFVNHMYTAMGMRTTCCSMIYNKVLRMSCNSRRQYTTGHIVTLMSTDVETFHLFMEGIHALLFSPLTLVAFIAFEVHNHGIAVVAGVAAILLFVVLRYMMGRHIGHIRQTQERLTDRRVHLMSELITAIKVIKMYCWEKPFAARAKEFRRAESKANMKRSLLVITGFCSSYTIGSVVAFLVLIPSFLLGHDISPENTVRLIGWLKAMQLLTFVLTPFAFGTSFEALGASERIKKFLMAEEYISQCVDALTEPDVARIKLTYADAIWDPEAASKDQKMSELNLKNINIWVESGALVGVTGRVGSGKTSLLMAVLGELELSKGDLSVRGSTAYVPQESWVISDTVRRNILLDRDFEQGRYDAILKACALDVDMKRFPHHDLTLVGERGLSLSGGQKARLNLARAIYQNADIYLFDDPLAAVDDKVGKHIFNEVICGLLKTKLRILVTHNLNYLPLMDNVIVLDKGEVVLSGKHSEIKDDLTKYVIPSRHRDNIQETPVLNGKMRYRNIKERRISCTTLGDLAGNLQVGTREEHHGPHGHKSKQERYEPPDGSPLETMKTGGIGYTVYKKYIQAGHGKVFIPAILICILLTRMSHVSSDWILSQWQTKTPPSANLTIPPGIQDDDMWSIMMVGCLILGLLVFSQLAAILICVMVVTASRRLYTNMFNVVLRAPMYFFETNPVGGILNRFSRDTGFMDIFLIFPAYVVCQVLGTAASYAVYACIIFPWMVMVAVTFVTVTFIFLRFSLSCLRDVKRIEGSCRSPAYSHLSLILQGLPVIRAFRKQRHFLSEAYSYLDTHTAAWHIYLATQRFLGICIDFFASVFCVVYIIVTVLSNNPGVENAGASGLSFIYLLYLLATFQFGFQMMAEVETIMTSVERIQQFGRLEQEAPEHTDVQPPPGWPSKGEIQLKDMSLTYRGMLEPALGPITVNISQGEKVGIIGRTGAGKSSLFVSLLRMVEPTGSIKIDGIEITKMGLTDLRSNISVIPQDPVLFSGSLRLNLDPFEEYTDPQIWQALRQVQLVDKMCGLLGGLSADTGEAGGNFSVGEKQLLCMARALLRRNRIIIVDEATANVDNRTDVIIQDTLRSEFADSTVLTIAHRINTIITYDKIMVLGDGRLIEYDHPHTLLEDSSGMLHQVARETGHEAYGQLCEMALQSLTSSQCPVSSSGQNIQSQVNGFHIGNLEGGINHAL